MTTIEVLKQAKSAVLQASRLTEAQMNEAVFAIASALEGCCDLILSANEIDVKNAAQNGMGEVMLDRLRLTKERVLAMASGMRAVANLPCPTGKVLQEIKRPNGLVIKKISVPLGVVAIIFESRPNVAADAAALAIKSGNVCVLKGGKEAFNSISAIVSALKSGLKSVGLPEDLVNTVPDTSRESAKILMTANSYVDILIPRGGAGLINACVREATVPCIQTGTGICHIYVEKSADIEMALEIVKNAKTSRPSVCNAAEVLLVDREVAGVFLPLLKQKLSGVELRLCPEAQKIIEGTKVAENDFDTEFLDYILAVKVVKNHDEAISHILAHSTHHSEAIITQNSEIAELFCAFVDSAAVYVNASTRFTDGGEFGLGCEIGISTQKLHARGPMGLAELTTYKYIITGNGQVR